MKALVIYDSAYGNTARIARAIADALAPFGDSQLLRAGEVDLADLESIDILIVGSPTQGGRPTKAIQELLGRIPANTLDKVRVAAFDTRLEGRLAKLFGYAAGRIADSLKQKGGRLVVEPAAFIVKGKEGPLKEGELERAAAWAKGISASIG